MDYARAIAEDYAAVLDHLAIHQTALICLGADFEFALRLAALRPGLVTGITAASARLPGQSAEQYQRMDKWQRFILANARYAPRILPFLVQAGYSFARRIGKEKFLASVNAGSAADLATFQQPEVREAMVLGSEVCLSDRFSAHEAFTREVISSEADWSALILETRVPCIVLQGDQDPQMPLQTSVEMRSVFPNLDIRIWPGNGQLLFFNEWPRVLDLAETFLPPARG